MFNRVLGIVVAVILTAGGLLSPLQSVEWMWNGYAGVNYEDSSEAGKHGSFDAYVLSLSPKVLIDEKTSVIGQIDWEHAPFIDVSTNSDGTKSLDKRASGEITLSNAYIQYALSDLLKINAGKFFVPIGFYNQILYAIPTYPTLKIPAESVYKRKGNGQEDAVFFQRYGMGLWLSGNYSIVKTKLGYDLYLANGRSFKYHEDDNDNKSVGGRVKMAWKTFATDIRPIVSFYTDKYNAGTPLLPVTRSQRSIVPGLEMEAGNLLVKSEIAASRIKNEDGSKYKDFSAYYIETYYTFLEKFTPYLRFEAIEPDKDVKNDREKETTVGLAYHLIPWVSQIKFQVRLHDFEDSTKQSFKIYGVGIAVGF